MLQKIPVELFLDDIKDFLICGIQTDGSSFEIDEIATLNDAKVGLLPDRDVNWYIDYNYEYIDDENNLPVGTLKIPALFAQKKEALEIKDYETASKLQLEMNDKVKELQNLYIYYIKNIF